MILYRVLGIGSVLQNIFTRLCWYGFYLGRSYLHNMLIAETDDIMAVKCA